MLAKNSDFEKLRKLAADVMRLSRNILMVNMRFMDMALNALKFTEWDLPAIATDGKNFFYNPMYVLLKYRDGQTEAVRDHLHIVMHCIYRHMFVCKGLDTRIWDLACDIAVENTINGLGIDEVVTERCESQNEEAKRLTEDASMLTAEKLYRYFLEAAIPESELERLEKLFRSDDHATWRAGQAEIRAKSSGAKGEPGDEPGQTGASDDAAIAESSFDTAFEKEKQWREISERVHQDLETFSKKFGDTAGSLMQNLAEIGREKYDYEGFLRRFAVSGEQLRINDEEFDNIFYTFGLERYGNMPLIEPLEYKEVKSIREFVLAIDTSGSVAGETVQKFVQKTYNVLKSAESFFSKINLHIIQCDADIREEVKITSQDEFDAYIEDMTIKGLGGTDFRPVFTRVDEMIERGEFSNLKGLIYFTDGVGAYPEKKPPYETAFVFLDEDYAGNEVPVWAIRLVLQSEEI